MPIPAETKPTYTYADYLSWPDDERWELIHGKPFNMTPAPKPQHQRIVTRLAAQFVNILKGNPCEPFVAPFDVRLPSTEDADKQTNDTVVQPDISVVCDPDKIDDLGCLGPPDLIVEVLSEKTGSRDESCKLKLYEEQDVREYWLVNPWDQTVRIYNLNADAKYDFPRFFTKLEIADSHAIQGLKVDLNDVFPEM